MQSCLQVIYELVFGDASDVVSHTSVCDGYSSLVSYVQHISFKASITYRYHIR